MPLTAAQFASPYFALYGKAKRLHWDPADIDLSADRAQWEAIKRDHASEKYPEQILRLTSLFYEGEESVTRTLAPFCSAVSRAGLGVDKELFLTTQLYEEAKHFDFFARYFNEVFREDDPGRLVAVFAESMTHSMGVVEAMLAPTGYVGAHDALATRGWLPGLQEGFRLIRRDEGRHVTFGMRVIAELTTQRPELRDVVAATFERHLPNVLATVAEFDYPQPLVDIDKLSAYALMQYQRFAGAAGPGGETLGEAEYEED